MDLTVSYEQAFPQPVRARYEFAETRNAAAILEATNPLAFKQLVDVLDGFVLLPADLLVAGGQESDLAARLNESFRTQGWREARVDTIIRLSLRKMPLASAGERSAMVVDTEQTNEGYKVDNFRDRVALDVEWNAKDGNLDRDISAYRALYEAALIDVGVMLTRTQPDLRALAYELRKAAGMPEVEAKKMLGTTTTTNKDKLLPRVTRGDAGGCPFLAIFICQSTFSDA